MRKKYAAVLDVGSSALHFMVAERGLNGTFIIKSSAEVSYSGYSDQAFFDVSEFEKAVGTVIRKAGDVMKDKTDVLYVGVPGEFTVTYCKYFNISLQKKKRITDEDVNKLYDSAFVARSNQHKLIARSAVNYVLSGNRKVSVPVGEVSDTLGGFLSFTLCLTSFLKIVGAALRSNGITKTEYFPASLAEVLYLFPPYERDKGGILLDVGYLSSTFTYFSGDGILFDKSFSLGGGYVTAKLLNDFNLPFAVSEKMKRTVNIGYNPFSSAKYEIEDENKLYSASVSDVNASVKEVLDAIAEQTANCIEEGVLNYNGNITIYLTGGGISYIRGAKEYLSGRLGAIVKCISPDLPLFDKPINSSVFSLMDVALSDKNLLKEKN